jgi:hypothetical protein
VSASSREREPLGLADIIALLDGDLLDGDTTMHTIPSGRNGNTADRPKRNTPRNSPGEPSAQ